MSYESTRKIMTDFLEQWPTAWNGPGHIVLADDNLETHWIESCLKEIDGLLSGDLFFGKKLPHDELIATRDILHVLLAIPEDDRLTCDDGYDLNAYRVVDGEDHLVFESESEAEQYFRTKYGAAT